MNYILHLNHPLCKLMVTNLQTLDESVGGTSAGMLSVLLRSGVPIHDVFLLFLCVEVFMDGLRVVVSFFPFVPGTRF